MALSRALPLLLRNSARVQGIIRPYPKILGCSTLSLNTAKPFSQLLNEANKNKNLITSSQSKINFVVATRGLAADHSKLWTIEKIVAVALIGVIPATFLSPNNILDNIFAVLVTVHMHWGLEACVVDYVRPIIFGSIIPKIAILLLYIISAATLGGLIYYNQNSIGIGCTVRKIWEINEDIKAEAEVQSGQDGS